MSTVQLAGLAVTVGGDRSAPNPHGHRVRSMVKDDAGKGSRLGALWDKWIQDPDAHHRGAELDAALERRWAGLEPLPAADAARLPAGDPVRDLERAA